VSFLAEFRRNLWLEFSPQRLVALPAIVLVLVLLNRVANRGDPGDLAELGSWIFYLMVFLWGSRRAAAAVTEEVNGGTWTGQRLSALSPAALVFGKLFGATAFVWFGGLIGLALFAFGWLGQGTPVGTLLVELLQRLASGVFLHAVAVALTLVLLNKRRLVGRLGTTLPQLLALGAALLLLGLFARVSLFASVGLWQGEIAWYGTAYDGALFVAVTALVFALWALLACLRLMAAQLQRQQLPWAWPLFTLFCMAFVQGLATGNELDNRLVGPLAGPFGVALVFFYLALFAERNEPLRYRQCGVAFAGGQVRRGLALLPWWALAWPILLAVVLWRGAEAPLETGLWGELGRELGIATPQPLLANLGFALFALRDAAFVLFINAGRGQRADLTAFVYLLVLYGPLLALLGGLRAWTAMSLLAPLPLGEALPTLLSALAQAALLGLLAWRRWRALFRG
jgi:hypothetical protein